MKQYLRERKFESYRNSFANFKSKLSRVIVAVALSGLYINPTDAQVTRTESFDVNTIPPTNWTTGGASSYLYYTTAGTSPTNTPHTGAGELGWNSYNASAGTSADLITPVVDWSYRGSNTPTIKLWVYRDTTAYNSATYDQEGVNVYVNTTQSSTGGTLLGFIPRRGGLAASGSYLVSGVGITHVTGWYQYTFNVPSFYSSATNYIVFNFYGQYGDNTFIDDIQYVEYPNPYNFNISPNNGCSGMPTTFTNTSTDPNAYYYDWTFGDGNFQTYIQPNTLTHTYSYAGTYYPYVNVYNSGGTFLGSNSYTITVQQGTNGNISISKDSICPGETVYIDPAGNGMPISWSISDGYYSTTDYSFNHSFGSVGTYTVAGVFNTSCGNDTIRRNIVVTNTIQPNSAFNFYPSPSACPNKSVQMNPNDYSGTHNWAFGDGNLSGLQSPSHAYASIGTYTISHTATNLCGNNTTTTHTISIDNTTYPSTADFNFNPNIPVCPGVAINFNSNNYEDQWSWDFGDGVTGSGQNPHHTYTAAGTYTVTQTVTNLCGNSLSMQHTVTISNSLHPDSTFSVGPNPACPNDIIGLNPYEQYGTNYNWNFGDGTTSSVKYSNHQYTTAGTYTASLQVTNGCGLSSTYTTTVNVNGSLPLNINANINAYPQPACPGQAINMDAGVWGYPSYTWDFGDGTVISTANANASHAYAAAGTYTASVTIANNCGNDTILYKTISVNSYVPFPNYTLNAYPSSVCPGENISANAPYGYPTYDWNMGDGSPAFSSTNAYITYSYSSLGTKPISVKVTDYCGNDTTYLDTVQVINSTHFCHSSGGCSVSVGANTQACPNSPVTFWATNGYAWYLWKFGDGDTLVTSSPNAAHTYSVTGSYTYSLTITNFCGADTTIYNSIDINNSQQINSWTSVYANTDVACPNQAITFNTDNSYSSYQWNFGDGTTANGTANVSHTYTNTGTYNVTVTITNACGNSGSFSTTVTVSNSATFPSWMGLNAYPEPACPGSPINLQTTEGYSSYVWNFGDGSTLTSSTGLVSHVYSNAGNYNASVTITNACGQHVTLYHIVQINSSVTLSNIYIDAPNNPACAGDEVMLNINASGGTGGGGGNAGVTFVWNYGDGSPADTTIGIGSSHVYSTQGVYNVVVTATNACGNSATASKLITINSNSSPQLTPWNFGILSNNMNSGSGTISVCPGDLLVFYFKGLDADNLWDFGDGSTGTATEIIAADDGMYTLIRHAYATAGTYNYTLTLGNNCGNHTSLSKSVNVTSGMLVSGGFGIGAPTSTLGYTTCGLIDFIAYGGNNFSWDFGDGNTLTTISPLVNHSYTNPGNYAVSVTITNGCGNTATYVQTLVINGVGGTSVNALTNTPPTCHNGTNGAASINVSGGQAPYTYNWTNSLGQTVSTSANASNLAAGSYTVIATDVSGCEGSTSITITDPGAISLSLGTTNSSCGGNTGTATVSSITGGSAPYTYAWSNGQSTQTATGLSIGTYSVLVHDSNNCAASGNASVSESGATVTVSSTTDNVCSTDSTGSVNISISGGTAPYTFAWSNGASSQNISGLPAGTYSVIVTDANNCHATVSTSVTAPGAITVNAVTITPPTCGNFDGSAKANVSGGSGPYTYLWPGAGNQTTQTATGLPAGTYTVQVTDNNDCMQEGSVTLSNSNAPTVSSNVVNVSCNGLTDGSIDLTVSGGTSPYLYTWNTGANTQDVNGLSSGFYFVSIQDAAGCLSLRSFNLSQPDALAATISMVGATCGNTDGTATANPTGGTSPYTYSWSNSATSQTITGLATGGYTVSITDANGCNTSANTAVTSTVTPVDICMVTVDSLSTHNIILWDKSGLNATDSFRIYREDVTNVYTWIGSVAYDSLSEYHDYGADPNVTTKRYKISTVDNCGNESTLSNYHNTIYIVYSGSGQFSWNVLYTIENGPNPVDNYLLMRDDNSTGAWAQVASTAGTQLNINDPNFASFPNASYRVETSWNITCTATRGAINTSRSNIKSPSSIGVRNNSSDNNEIVIYPNPAHTVVSVYFGKAGKTTIEMHNSLGQLVYQQSTDNAQHTISLTDYRAGVYYVTVENENGKVVKKLIID